LRAVAVRGLILGENGIDEGHTGVQPEIRGKPRPRIELDTS
jgi:hypothetical protein